MALLLLSASQPSLLLLLLSLRSSLNPPVLPWTHSFCLPPPPGSPTPSCWARLACTPPGSLTLLLCPPLANRSTTITTGACICKCQWSHASFLLETQPEWQDTTSTSLWVSCFSLFVLIFFFISFFCLFFLFFPFSHFFPFFLGFMFNVREVQTSNHQSEHLKSVKKILKLLKNLKKIYKKTIGFLYLKKKNS